MLARGLVGGVRTCFDARDLSRHASCRGQEEVSRATSRIQDIEAQNSLTWIVWVC